MRMNYLRQIPGADSRQLQACLPSLAYWVPLLRFLWGDDFVKKKTSNLKIRKMGHDRIKKAAPFSYHIDSFMRML